MIATGLDVVENSRFDGMVERLGQRFVRRVFTERELESGAVHSGGAGFPALFAAKEAFLKALGTGLSRGIGWHAVEVLPRPSGRGLYMEVSEDIAAELLAGRGISVSVSVTGRLSAALVTISPEGGGA